MMMMTTRQKRRRNTTSREISEYKMGGSKIIMKTIY